MCKDTTFCFLIRIFSCKINLKIYSFLQFAIYGQCFNYNLSLTKASVMIVCSYFRVSWFHLRAFSWLPAVMMQNVTSFIQKVALHSRIHDRNFRFCKFFPSRPEGAEALSPGHRPGLFWAVTCRPVRAKALKYRTIYKAFALQGDFLIVIVPRAMPWAKSFCPLPFPSAGDRWFRACCL